MRPILQPSGTTGIRKSLTTSGNKDAIINFWLGSTEIRRTITDESALTFGFPSSATGACIESTITVNKPNKFSTTLDGVTDSTLALTRIPAVNPENVSPSNISDSAFITSSGLAEHFTVVNTLFPDFPSFCFFFSKLLAD